MKILSISVSPPYPPVSGGQVRLYNLLPRLARRNEVWLAAFCRSREDRENLRRMGAFGIHVIPLSRLPLRQHLMTPRGVSELLAGKPVDVIAWASEEAARTLKTLVVNEGIQVVQAEEMFLSDYLTPLPAPVRVSVALDVLSVTRGRRIATLPQGWKRLFHVLETRRLRRYEARVLRRFHVIAMSPVDAGVLRRMEPRASVHVIPNGVDTDALRPFPERTGSPPRLLFVGGAGHWPNLDAIRFLVGQIWPLVRRGRPDAELWLVGAGLEGVEWVRAMESSNPGVRVVGTVDEVATAYAQADVVVVPLRVGSGTRLKILEAMALGRPVVSTSIGCEGLDVQDGEHLLVRDAPKAFSDGILSLLEDRSLARRLVSNARRLVEEKYDWEKIAASLEALYAALAGGELQVVPTE